ncbi:lectin subunit alpha-like [Uranotaenia lowii]|uniref:lectin subunit alpha-like n=1 Tax=Uranotaenia lowii TaxID=190385 RepID=UPI00247A852E|nr:lectin subunit alpha-like [Uranotaenia lowii]
MIITILLLISVSSSLATDFTIFLEEVTWFKAREICAKNNQRLVSIESLEKQNEVVAFLARNVRQARISLWIGATDFGQEGQFRWINSGRPMDYTRWAKGEPNQMLGWERCVEIVYDYYTKWNYQWNDMSCERPRNVLCETVIECVCPKSV